jgi:hypothetical protein
VIETDAKEFKIGRKITSKRPAFEGSDRESEGRLNQEGKNTLLRLPA